MTKPANNNPRTEPTGPATLCVGDRDALLTLNADVLNGGFAQYLDHDCGREADFAALAAELDAPDLALAPAVKVALRLIFQRAEALRGERPADHEDGHGWAAEWDDWEEACAELDGPYYDLDVDFGTGD